MGKTREFVTYVNGRFVPHSEALTEMSADGSSMSGGLYDAERTFNGDVFKLNGHLQRLYIGLRHANMDPGMNVDEMESLTLQVLDANRELLEVNDDFILGQVVSTSPSPDGGRCPSGQRRDRLPVHRLFHLRPKLPQGR